MVKVLLLLCAVVAAGCGRQSAEEVIAKRKDGALAKLAVYRDAVHNAVAHPVATPPTLPAKLVFSGEGKNAQLIHAEWVDEVGTHAESNLVSESSDFIETRNWCRGAQPSVSGMAGSVATRMFDDFENIKLFVAVETLSYSAGSVSGDTFVGGSFHGRLHFVDVAKGGSIGSIEIDSSVSSDTLQAHKGHEAAEVRSETWSRARDLISAALAPYLAPNQKPF